MPTNPPIDAVLVDNQPVSKSDARGYGNTRAPVVMTGADEVRAADLTAVTLIFVNPFFYRKDTADTTSADDGMQVVIDWRGNRFKRVPQFQIAVDAWGDITNSPSDRDQYDDEDGGFLFGSLTEGGLYVKLSDGSGDWSELVSLAGPSGAGDQYTIAPEIFDRPKAGKLVLRHIFEADVTFASDFGGSFATAETATTDEAVFSITKNGTQIGTLTFGSGADTGVFSTSGSPSSFNAEDVLRIIAPDPRDATLADISITLAGQR